MSQYFGIPRNEPFFTREISKTPSVAHSVAPHLKNLHFREHIGESTNTDAHAITQNENFISESIRSRGSNDSHSSISTFRRTPKCAQSPYDRSVQVEEPLIQEIQSKQIDICHTGTSTSPFHDTAQKNLKSNQFERVLKDMGVNTSLFNQPVEVFRTPHRSPRVAQHPFQPTFEVPLTTVDLNDDSDEHSPNIMVQTMVVSPRIVSPQEKPSSSSLTHANLLTKSVNNIQTIMLGSSQSSHNQIVQPVKKKMKKHTCPLFIEGKNYKVAFSPSDKRSLALLRVFHSCVPVVDILASRPLKDSSVNANGLFVKPKAPTKFAENVESKHLSKRQKSNSSERCAKERSGNKRKAKNLEAIKFSAIEQPISRDISHGTTDSSSTAKERSGNKRKTKNLEAIEFSAIGKPMPRDISHETTDSSNLTRSRRRCHESTLERIKTCIEADTEMRKNKKSNSPVATKSDPRPNKISKKKRPQLIPIDTETSSASDRSSRPRPEHSDAATHSDDSGDDTLTNLDGKNNAVVATRKQGRPCNPDQAHVKKTTAKRGAAKAVDPQDSELTSRNAKPPSRKAVVQSRVDTSTDASDCDEIIVTKTPTKRKVVIVSSEEDDDTLTNVSDEPSKKSSKSSRDNKNRAPLSNSANDDVIKTRSRGASVSDEQLDSRVQKDDASSGYVSAPVPPKPAKKRAKKVPLTQISEVVTPRQTDSCVRRDSRALLGTSSNTDWLDKNGSSQLGESENDASSDFISRPAARSKSAKSLVGKPQKSKKNVAKSPSAPALRPSQAGPGCIQFTSKSNNGRIFISTPKEPVKRTFSVNKNIPPHLDIF